MSAGNAGAAIGLANTNKNGPIGVYVQDVHTNAGEAGPAAEVSYDGVNGATYWDRNVIDELVDPAFIVPANSGAAAGKNAHWVTTGAAPMTVAADGLCDVALGVVTALATTGTYKTYLPAATVVPAGAFLWVFEV
jgi:hypothetical protein